MADLLGSLLPAGYAAPDVQAMLGGWFENVCEGSGISPKSTCNPTGSSPTATCKKNGSQPTNS